MLKFGYLSYVHLRIACDILSDFCTTPKLPRHVQPAERNGNGDDVESGSWKGWVGYCNFVQDEYFAKICKIASHQPRIFLHGDKYEFKNLQYRNENLTIFCKLVNRPYIFPNYWKLSGPLDIHKCLNPFSKRFSFQPYPCPVIHHTLSCSDFLLPPTQRNHWLSDHNGLTSLSKRVFSFVTLLHLFWHKQWKTVWLFLPHYSLIMDTSARLELLTMWSPSQQINVALLYLGILANK